MALHQLHIFLASVFHCQSPMVRTLHATVNYAPFSYTVMSSLHSGVPGCPSEFVTDARHMPSESQVVAFFQEQGLSRPEAASVYRQLYASSEPAPYSLETLAAKMVRWRRALPVSMFSCMSEKDEP